jgi:hypothetical protein
MRFDVPQFIEIEDKIFGPFTWKQFVYLCGGVGTGVVLFLVAPFVIFIIFGAPLIGIAILLAFYPVNNRPFSLFLESMVNYYSRSRNYRWRKEDPSVYKAEVTSPTPTHDYSHMPVGNDVGGLHSLARQLELRAIAEEQE